MRRRFGGGFTLLEVLVAVFVLAVGVLGAAATQLTALRTRHHSSLMSSGVQLASSLADSMRANLETMRAADSANPYLQLNYDAVGGAPQPPATSCFAGAGCSAAQLANAELYQLKQALHAGFPGGRVLVCRDSQPRNSALRWACAGAANAPIVIKLGWRDGSGDVAPSVAIALPGALE